MDFAGMFRWNYGWWEMMHMNSELWIKLLTS